jgi:hypothetical protein
MMFDDQENSSVVALLERVATALERIATALERGGTPSAAAVDVRAEAIHEIRRAIRTDELALASTLLDEFEIDHPDAVELQSLATELAERKVVAIEDRQSRLAAARRANDAEAVLSLRNELSPWLDLAAREILDREVVNWLMGVLMRRLRTGTVHADVAVLAERVAQSFPHRPEGASLKASLPTLRRSAGLCARCSEPYVGAEDACPKCLAGTPKIAELPESPDSPT